MNISVINKLKIHCFPFVEGRRNIGLNNGSEQQLTYLVYRMIQQQVIDRAVALCSMRSDHQVHIAIIQRRRLHYFACALSTRRSLRTTASKASVSGAKFSLGPSQIQQQGSHGHICLCQLQAFGLVNIIVAVLMCKHTRLIAISWR